MPLCSENCSDCVNLQIQGSHVENRNPNALLADYFYLPIDLVALLRSIHAYKISW